LLWKNLTALKIIIKIIKIIIIKIIINCKVVACNKRTAEVTDRRNPLNSVSWD